MIIKRDELFKYVLELRTPTKEGIDIGTGMFVSVVDGENSYKGWIVTAKHVAEKTDNRTQIIVATEKGNSACIGIPLFGDIEKWKHHPTVDMSALPIEFNSENEEYLINRLFPYDHFNLEHKSVSRDFELTIIGFPMGLGISGVFSPLSFRSYASSTFITFKDENNNKSQEYLCLENPSMGGYSGAPVFDLGYSTNGVLTTTKEKTICHGIIKGTMFDDTGGKISIVVPAFYLRELIE